MNKNELLFDMRFKDICDMYGFDCEKVEIIGNAIVMYTPNQYGCVVLDENYNIVYLGKNCFNKEYECNRNSIPEYIVNLLMQRYSMDVSDNMLFFNFKNLIELSSRIEVKDDKLFINGDMVDNKSLEDSKDLLYTSKFFGDTIEKYNLNNYHMLSMGISIPDMFEYSKIMMNEILSYLNECIEVNCVPCTKTLLLRLGMSNLDNSVDVLSLEATVRVLLRRNGYEVQNNTLVKIDEDYTFGELAKLHKKFVDDNYIGYGIVKLDDKLDNTKFKLIMK